jgi:hypothetical protein
MALLSNFWYDFTRNGSHAMKELVVMETVLSEQDTQTNGHAEWRDMSDAIMRLSNIASLDDLLHQALNSWLQQLAPALRW